MYGFFAEFQTEHIEKLGFRRTVGKTAVNTGNLKLMIQFDHSLGIRALGYRDKPI
jgi:hypothetical protein